MTLRFLLEIYMKRTYYLVSAVKKNYLKTFYKWEHILFIMWNELN